MRLSGGSFSFSDLLMWVGYKGREKRTKQWSLQKLFKEMTSERRKNYGASAFPQLSKIPSLDPTTLPSEHNRHRKMRPCRQREFGLFSQYLKQSLLCTRWQNYTRHHKTVEIEDFTTQVIKTVQKEKSEETKPGWYQEHIRNL